jgi:D-alanine-D-alanine ligase
VKVTILHDAVTESSRPDEVDALHQATLVGDALRKLGHQVATADVGLDLNQLSTRLRQSKPDLVFNLVESLAGHGRLIHVVPAMLEAWRIPFTGGGSISSLLTTNKPLTKAWLHQHGVPTPAWHYPQAPSLWEVTPPCACIVKPAWEDASVGIEDNAVVPISRRSELDAAIQAASQRYGEVFAEQFVEGREFNLSLLADGDEVEVLPVAEIEFVDYPASKPRIVGYAAKWSEDSFEYGATARRFDFADFDEALLERLRTLAVKCWHLCGLRGYARVDFRVDEVGRPWVLEVNVNPCLSADAGFMAAAQRRGLPSAEVIARIVAAAMTPYARKEVAFHA